MNGSMRRLLIDRLLTEKEYVTFAELLEVLKVSPPTLKRDLSYMRKELRSPIVYSRTHRAYRYEPTQSQRQVGMLMGKRRTAGQKKTRAWYSPEELYVLVRTVQNFEQLIEREPTEVYAEFKALRSRMLDVLDIRPLTGERLLRKVKVIDTAPIHDEPLTFETLGISLSLKRRVQIMYDNTIRNRTPSYREISPQRFVHYRNRWYVDAFCHTKNAPRTFAVEHIRMAQPLAKAAYQMNGEQIQTAFDAGYGMFRSGELRTAELLFDETVATHVRRQLWHPNQRMHVEGEQVRVSIPYTDSTELVGELVRWGTHVKIIGPAELRREVRQYLQETLSQYDD